MTMINIKKQTKPNMVSKNLVVYSKKDYNKMINKKYVQDDLKNDKLYLIDHIHGDTKAGIIKAIYYNSIDVDIFDNYKYINNLKSGKFVAGMNYIADKHSYNKFDGIEYVYDMSLLDFEVVPNLLNKPYYEWNCTNKSFLKVYKELFKISDLDRENANNLYANILQIYNPEVLLYKEITKENSLIIYNECARNPWYFFRHILKMPSLLYNEEESYELTLDDYEIINAYLYSGDYQYFKKLLEQNPNKYTKIALIGIHLHSKYFSYNPLSLKDLLLEDNGSFKGLFLKAKIKEVEDLSMPEELRIHTNIEKFNKYFGLD